MSDLQRAIEDAIMFHELQLRSMQDGIDKDFAPSATRWYRDAKGYTKTALTALREKQQRQPDPITGLVPCGCGGKAGFHYSVMMRDNDCYVECGICGGHTKVVLSEDKARDAWNTAMGWKGGAE